MSSVEQSKQRPRIILVTGAPGSGKTTLGTDLARALRVPFVARDDVRGGMFMTAGAWSGRPGAIPTSEEAVEAFLRIVEALVDLGVSCVVEYVVRRERPDDLRRMTAIADCVVVRTACRDAGRRFAERNEGDRLLNRQPVLDALGFATIDDHTRDAVERMASIEQGMQDDFDLPRLRVDTDDGYDPVLDDIVTWLGESTA